MYAVRDHEHPLVLFDFNGSILDVKHLNSRSGNQLATKTQCTDSFLVIVCKAFRRLALLHGLSELIKDLSQCQKIPASVEPLIEVLRATAGSDDDDGAGDDASDDNDLCHAESSAGGQNL